MTDTDNQQTESSTPIVEGAVAPMTSEEVAQPPVFDPGLISDEVAQPPVFDPGLTPPNDPPSVSVATAPEPEPNRPHVWHVGAQKFVDTVTGE